MKYRVGRKQKRAILDQKGHLVAMFEKGQEKLANQFCNLYNNKKADNMYLFWKGFVLGIFATLIIYKLFK